MNSNQHISILQYNLNGSQFTTQSLLNHPNSKKLAILTVQEQYCPKRTGTSLPHQTWTIIETPSQDPNKTPRAAIYVNKRILPAKSFQTQRWLAEQCRFEFVRFVRFAAEPNKATVRKLQNRTDPLFCSCSFRTERAQVLKCSVRDEHEPNCWIIPSVPSVSSDLRLFDKRPNGNCWTLFYSLECMGRFVAFSFAIVGITLSICDELCSLGSIYILRSPVVLIESFRYEGS
jgi:hypothetical protein